MLIFFLLEPLSEINPICMKQLFNIDETDNVDQDLKKVVNGEVGVRKVQDLSEATLRPPLWCSTKSHILGTDKNCLLI